MTSERQEWQELIAQADNLDAVKSALVREQVVRATMAETGETREVVTETVDAFESMDDEAVLDLTEGQPTTMAAAISEYIDVLEGGDEVIPRDRVMGDLHAILHFPWSGEEALVQLHETNPSTRLTILDHPENDRKLVVNVGGQTVYEIDWEQTGSGGSMAAVEVAAAVHKAILARVVADRDHHVQLTASDRRALLAWLEQPNGAWRPDSPSRVSLNAVQGGGVIVRTWPYRWLSSARSRS